MREIFRAYDIRGIYPDQINEGIAGKIALSLGEKMFKRGHTVVLGRDIRRGSDLIYESIETALGASGVRVLGAGMITTPMLTFLVNRFSADGGIMVTASHNPKEYNGMKVIGKGLVQIGGEEIWKILESK